MDTRITKKFMCEKDELPLSELVLFDTNAERQEVIGKFAEVLFREEYP